MTAVPVALVTGASGQDGSYLLDRLVAEGYAVCALVRPADTAALSGRGDAVTTLEADLADRAALARVVAQVDPDEIYNLGGVSSVAQSWQEPELTAEVTGLAALTLLHAASDLAERRGPQRPVRVLQASSAEVFGEPAHTPQDESTPIRPVSPYGAAKAFAQHSVRVYRQRGLFAASAILYNHESPRRPAVFVTRKITSTVARIHREGGGTLTLGNLAARRDWGWAPDYVEAMVRAARHTEPLDVVVATGVAHSVEDFVAAAFARVGITEWQAHVTVDPALFRPADPAVLVGDASLARRELGWAPTVGFAEIVGAMVEADLAEES